MKIAVSVVLTVITTSVACASWFELPLETVIQQSHVVVIGDITSITVAGSPERQDQSQYDVANIAVREVLLNTLTNRVIEVKQELPLSMPSVQNKPIKSTDIRYTLGQSGIWILEFKDKAFWATYPKDFQPMSEEQEVRAIIRKLRAETPNK